VGTAVNFRAQRRGTVAIGGRTGFASAPSGPDKKLTSQAIFDITTQMRVPNSHFASTGVTALPDAGSRTKDFRGRLVGVMVLRTPDRVRGWLWNAGFWPII